MLGMMRKMMVMMMETLGPRGRLARRSLVRCSSCSSLELPSGLFTMLSCGEREELVDSEAGVVIDLVGVAEVVVVMAEALSVSVSATGKQMLVVP